jgi:hypothetical protein
MGLGSVSSFGSSATIGTGYLSSDHPQREAGAGALVAVDRR